MAHHCMVSDFPSPASKLGFYACHSHHSLSVSASLLFLTLLGFCLTYFSLTFISFDLSKMNFGPIFIPFPDPTLPDEYIPVVDRKYPLWMSRPGCNLASADRPPPPAIVYEELDVGLSPAGRCLVVLENAIISNDFVAPEVEGFGGTAEDDSGPSVMSPFWMISVADWIPKFSVKTIGDGSGPYQISHSGFADQDRARSVSHELPGCADGLIPGNLNYREVRPLFLTASKAVAFLLGLYLGVFIKKHCFASWRT